LLRSRSAILETTLKLSIDRVVPDFRAATADIWFDCEGANFPLDTLGDCYRRNGAVACYFGADFAAAERAFAAHYDKYNAARTVDRFNGVNFALDSELPADLVKVEVHAGAAKVVEHLLGEREAGILNSKLVVKDARFSGPVFLHQDSAYQVGPDNITCFFLLTDLRAGPLRESTIRALPGTQLFGHLGDVGEIDRTILDADWPEIEFCYPKFTFIFMNPHLWHYSRSSDLGSEVRGIYAFTCHRLSMLSIRRPGSRELLPSNRLNTGKIFVRSRVSRLIELQKQVDDKEPRSG
jgi:hypothetical protein